MVRINKQEIKGITGTRKTAPIAAESDNDAIIIEDEDKNVRCDGDECHIDWQDEP